MSTNIRREITVHRNHSTSYNIHKKRYDDIGNNSSSSDNNSKKKTAAPRTNLIRLNILNGFPKIDDNLLIGGKSESHIECHMMIGLKWKKHSYPASILRINEEKKRAASVWHAECNDMKRRIGALCA